MATYSVILTSIEGSRIKVLDQFIALTYTLTINQMGTLQIDVPKLAPRFLSVDNRLEIWRQVPGGKKYLEGDTCWFIRDWEEYLTQQGQEYIRIIAYSTNFILDAPVIAYKSTTSQASKSDQADDMIKAIARENIESSAADSDRDLSGYITIDADTSDGPSIDKSFSYRNMLATMREIAQASDYQGTPLFFGLTYDPNSQDFTFATRTQQWGVDRSQANRVVLSARNGTLSDVRRSYLSSEERTVAYIGGRGQGEDRTVTEVEDSERSNLSPFNRREVFVNASNSDDDQLTGIGQAALKNYRPVEIFSARFRDTQAVQYGREIKFGDRCIAEHNGRSVSVRLDSVRVRVERGREDIGVELRADE
ncbi:MAG: hypothetical protein KDJ65_01770 [Anaerolineae bacterium]|nr:hypothetical protein [Anaerolineae bacterium]